MIDISRESEINLINILIDQDIISGKDLLDIKKASADGEKSQLDAVFELKITDEDKILDLLVKEQSLQVVSLKDLAVAPEIRSILPSNYIRMNFIAPFKMEGNTLHIAISDSSKLSLMRNLKTITKKNIELHAGKVTEISDFIQKLLKEGETTIEAIQKANKEKIQTFDYEVDESAEVLDETPEEDIEALENESEVIKFSTAVVAEAIKSGVSDIHIEPYRFSSRVRYRLDGMLKEQEHFSKFLHSNYGAVVTRFKIMGKLDIAERRLPQDGAIPFKIDGKVIDLRLSMLPTANNERIVMRVLNKDAGDISLEQLNFEEQDLKNLRKAIHGILVGEMRDKETVDIGLKAALTGHLVFSTLHTNDAPSSITRLQNMGTPDYLISAACTLVLAQRLARKTCSECREPDTDVTPKVLEEFGFTPEQSSRAKVLIGKGCARCSDSGYKGRMGIYEVLNVTKPIKEGILRKATTPELKEIAKKEGFRPMSEMGREMILSGDLSIREFDRVLTSE